MRIGARPPPKSVAERQRTYRQRCQTARAQLAEAEAKIAALEALCARQQDELNERTLRRYTA